MLKLPDGRLKALVQGVAKAKIIKYVGKEDIFRVKVEQIEELLADDVDLEIEALMRNVREQSEKILSIRGEMTSEISTILESIEENQYTICPTHAARIPRPFPPRNGCLWSGH